MSDHPQHVASALAGTWMATKPFGAPIWIIPQSDDRFEVRMPGWFALSCRCLGGGPTCIFTRVQGTDNTFQWTTTKYEIQQTFTIVKLSADKPYVESENIINIDGKVYVRGLQSPR